MLPGATWGEKTGTFTNADRTVHLCEKAVDPPGEARSDLEIFLDYARRMDFRDREGAPLIKWDDPRVRLPGLDGVHARAALRLRASELPAPARATGCSGRATSAPGGTSASTPTLDFNTDSDYTESFGEDLATGAAKTEEQHRALHPARTRIPARRRYEAAPELPDDEYPLQLTTGRTIYHFHTRSKTGRVPELNAAAPDAWVELNPQDAAELGIADGDVVRVEIAAAAPRGPGAP